MSIKAKFILDQDKIILDQDHIAGNTKTAMWSIEFSLRKKKNFYLIQNYKLNYLELYWIKMVG